VQLIEEICWRKIDQLYQGRFMDEKLYSGEILYSKDKFAQVVSSATSGKKEKGGTFKDTLDLHRKGKSTPEIAAIRGLTLGTIKNHMAKWIARGEINVYDVLPAEAIDSVIAFIEERNGASPGEIRSGLGGRYDYDDIRMITSHVNRKRRETQKAAESVAANENLPKS
jgi:uncharacterized protein YpbB